METHDAVRLKEHKRCFYIQRLLALLAGVLLFIPEVYPGRPLFLTHIDIPLLTAAFSLPSCMNRSILLSHGGWLPSGQVTLLQFLNILLVLGLSACILGACMSLGNNRMKKLSGYASVSGALLMLISLFALYCAQKNIHSLRPGAESFPFPGILLIWGILSAALLIVGLAILKSTRLIGRNIKCCMAEKYKLFLMLLPVLVLTFVFSYLPIYGWRSFFFSNSTVPSNRSFVGFQWFSYMFENTSRLFNLFRILRNTLVLSGLTLLSSVIPLAFAVFLREIQSRKLRSATHIYATIPWYLSWTTVYVVAFAFFSSDGFFNNFLNNIFNIHSTANYLSFSHDPWAYMLLWHLWKTIGWNSIVYFVAISGIDERLYETAHLDGAGRWTTIRHVTLPALLPLYLIVLLISFSDLLSSDMQQYLLFHNEANQSMLTVMDLYTYQIGIEQDIMPYSTLISACKTAAGLLLLLLVNSISKSVRGKNIV